jgi:hypothetical protein
MTSNEQWALETDESHIMDFCQIVPQCDALSKAMSMLRYVVYLALSEMRLSLTTMPILCLGSIGPAKPREKA